MPRPRNLRTRGSAGSAGRVGPPPALPVEAARIVAVLAAVWVGLQAVGIVVGLGLIGRHGDGPARHVDAPVHDWFIAHRYAFVSPSKVVAAIFDAPTLGAIVVVASAVVVGLAWSRGRFRWSILGPLVAYFGAEATVFVVRAVIHRPRPISANFPAPGAVAGVHETSWSFPSGHATASMAVLVALAGLITLHWKRSWVFPVAVIIALAVAVSRLVLGVHWFTDVATGAALGGIWGAAVCWVERRCDEPARSSRDGVNRLIDAGP